MSPVFLNFLPSVNSTSSEYVYTSIGCNVPLKVPSHPSAWLLDINTICPHRLYILQSILPIPNPRTLIILFTPNLPGVNALGTSSPGRTIAGTSKQNVSVQPATFVASKHTLYVPVAPNW